MLGKFIYFYILIIIVILFNSNYIFSYGWQKETVDYEYSGDFSSIAIDSNDYQHISYLGASDSLKYAYWDGSKWNIAVIEDGKYDCRYTSITLDSKGYPHISYSTMSNNYNLRHAFWDGYKWNIEVIENDTEGWLFLYSSIAVDSKDYPHISYYSEKNGDLKYAYFDGSQWHIETLDSDGDTGLTTSIAIDSNDNVYILYHKWNNSLLKIAFFNGAGWKIGIVDTNSPPYNDTSIAIDKNDRPHIAYKGVYGGWAVKYAYWDGSKWVINVVDNENIGGYVSLALDSKDRPHISYEESYDDYFFLKYAYWDGYNWQIRRIDGGGYIGTSIAIDHQDNPHISYELDSNLKHAWYEGPYPGIDLISFTAKPNNDAITLNWSISTDEDISGFNLYRRIVPPGAIHELPLHTLVGTDYNLSKTVSTISPVGEGSESPASAEGEWQKINTTLITGTNPYSYTDRDVMPETSYEYKLEAVVSNRDETLGTTQCKSGNENPASFEIARIYPTPALSHISIDVIIPEQTDIEITIYDITGRKVATVVSGLYNPGEYTLTSDISYLANGVYIVKMATDEFSASKNFVIAK
jgi:hypothetical protein